MAAEPLPTTVPTKPWISDWPAYLNGHPGQHLIIGQTTEPALSAEEAETMARTDAANQIAEILGGRFGTRESQVEIASSIQRDDWIADRQIDAKERPYGTIWKAAILIDATPDKLNALAGRIDGILARQHRIKALVVGVSGAGIAAIIFCYLMLNWITRGYFRSRLALVSGLLIVAGIIGAVHLIRWV
jgi:hypothetical protein